MSGSRRPLAPVAALVLPAYLSACFRYVPEAPVPLPAANTEVRVTLAEPIDISMGEFTLNQVTRIEGTVAEADGDTLSLVAKWLYPQVGRKYDALYGSYAIPAAGIQQLETWRFSGKRTVLFTVAAVGLTAFVLSQVWRVVQGNPPIEPPPPGASLRAPR
jgi:hypothetical protein